MPIEPPYPELDELLTLIGDAGFRLSEIDASEGSAGNISVYVGWPIEPRRRFPIVETVALPQPAPELAGKTLIVTGSGRRLREIRLNPACNLGVLLIDEAGLTAQLHTAPDRLFTRLTSELNSHLAVHADQVTLNPTNFHALIHAQPIHLTYLSHIPRYQDEKYLNQHLLRWEPELIVHFPEGIGHVPFEVPGSKALQDGTMRSLRDHKLVIWGKHGVMARSDTSVKRACDRIEYAETGARYECLNLANGEPGEGLTAEQIRAIAAAFNVQQDVF
ncbi:MAG: class II aldolase/adducin family protein [Anaerolineae bacterium]|nr:class II aldolase/adducin family protein [Anaerolineae bacterium]